MPWTGAEFADRHNHALKGRAADSAATQANAILKKTGDEGLAIAVANKHAGKARQQHRRPRSPLGSAR
jgi:uncharacterized protein YdaT